jgi:hypothetical protein
MENEEWTMRMRIRDAREKRLGATKVWEYSGPWA